MMRRVGAGKACLRLFTNAAAGRDQECADWYVEEHVRHMVDRFGFKSGQHFQFDMQQYFPDFPFKYLTLYDVDGVDFERLYNEHAKSMKAHVASLDDPDADRPKAEMPISEALDLQGARSFWLTALHGAERKKAHN
ncbi:hypothetical protein [Sphingobium tyrosinilyticum]